MCVCMCVTLFLHKLPKTSESFVVRYIYIHTVACIILIRSRDGSHSILTACACPCPLYARTCLCVCECTQFVLYISQLQWHAVYKTSVGIYIHCICYIV